MLVWLVFATASHAGQAMAEGCRWYMEAGQSVHGNNTQVAGIGLLIPTSRLAWLPRKAGPLSLHWDVSMTHWRVNRPSSGHRAFTQLAALGVWRHTLGGSQSRWFAELGVGGAVFDRLYHGASRRFSTAFQFVETIGVGYALSKGSELSLRYSHLSNGSIKKPNPGEDLVRLRLSMGF